MRGGFVLGLLFYLATGPAVAQPAYTPEPLAASYAKGWRPLQPPPDTANPTLASSPSSAFRWTKFPQVQASPEGSGLRLLGQGPVLVQDLPPARSGGEIGTPSMNTNWAHCHGWVHGYPGKAAVDAEITRGKEVADKLIQTGVERLQSRGCQAQITLFGKPENCP